MSGAKIEGFLYQESKDADYEESFEGDYSEAERLAEQLVKMMREHGLIENQDPYLERHIDEILIALAMSAVNDSNARAAMDQIPNLKGCQVHTSVMLSAVDINTFKRLGVDLTSEPVTKPKGQDVL